MNSRRLCRGGPSRMSLPFGFCITLLTTLFGARSAEVDPDLHGLDESFVRDGRHRSSNSRTPNREDKWIVTNVLNQLLQSFVAVLGRVFEHAALLANRQPLPRHRC